jgi:putative sigma-54 modulation protein
MQVDIAFKNINSGDSIKEFVNDKTSKLEKYFNGKIHAKWMLAQEKDEYIAHLHILGNSIDYFGEARLENLLSSIEASVDKVEKQLKKHKEILQNHHKG